MENDKIKEHVKKGYGKIAKFSNLSNSISFKSGCCNPDAIVNSVSKKSGYSQKELTSAPSGSNLGLGCGNPTALASIKKGETILDLGSGAGFDSFLAAKETGETGKVIGVDITPEMIEKAKLNAQKGNYKNVEFIEGDIENLPIADNSIDLVISNCVINLSNQKEQVFKEIYRVLKPGGRMMISDIVRSKELPKTITESVVGHIACLAGSIQKDIYIDIIKKAGFVDINIENESTFPIGLLLTDPIAASFINISNTTHEKVKNISNSIASVSIRAYKK
ncbi:MAG: arsenite S-adenosylmethyltransferase [Bacteroidetes bacterium GWF2_33_16]|nr:MAG: arsenite S-adenosylmethyltransferase [Bacteroidetes bacterium GWE2_32_14]OFY08820.1 MAG: arsenite S-adenosylmethyltransferase [Bacteroidetes bacterium GWF2_33_16]